MAEELRSRGYPTRSVFNWRSPLPIWLVGHLPYPWIGRATLSLLGLAMLVLGTAVVLREERPRIGRALLTALLLTGPTLVCGKRGMFISMHEPWAGTLIAISVSTVGLNWRGPAVVAGLLAPFFRVLALPYPLLCAALAWREHRYKELAVWVAGLLAWAAFFGFHWLEVTGVMPPGGRFHTHSWIQFGGLPFIIASVSANVYLLLLPPWVAALYFVAAMFGLLGWHTIGGRQVAITVSLFVLLFSVVGQPFNLYWGMLYAPLLCFGAARFPASLHDLWVAAQLSGSRSRWPSGMTEKVGSAQGPWRLVVRATGEVVVPTLILADRFWLRFAGLQFRPRLPQGAGLLLVPCGSVHTCFLSFPIDLICLDSQGRVVGVRKHLRPWRAAIAPAGTHAIIGTRRRRNGVRSGTGTSGRMPQRRRSRATPFFAISPLG